MTITVIVQSSVWTTVASSVSAVGSAGALFMAAKVYRRQAADKRAQQASRVLTFVRGNGAQLQWAAQNLSDLPIFDVWFMSEVPPTERPDKMCDGYVVIDRIDPISEVGRVKVSLVTEQQGAMYVTYENTARTKRSVIEFTDAACNRWRRTSEGELTEVSKRRQRVWPVRIKRTARNRSSIAA